MLELLYPNCAGLDVHKKFVVVCCLWGDPQGQSHKELRKFTTLTEDLQALKVWLQEKGVTHVAMESTGVYWQPIHNILEDHFKLLLVNAQAVKRMPGRKTDMKDAEWLATLLQHGLLQPSFIPNREQRELRELTRYRMSLIQERTRFTQRLEKVLEGTNLKLSSVVSDLKGVSAQATLRAMIQGEQNPQVLAELAKGQLRNKRELLERTLVGHLSEHQRFFLKDLLVHLDFLDEQITQLEERIQAKLNQMPLFSASGDLARHHPSGNPSAGNLDRG